MTPMLGLENTLMSNGGTTMSLPLWTPSQISTALWLDADDASTITINSFTGQNLFTEPEGFDTAQWTKTNCTITSNTASTSPDGGYTSEKIVSVNGTSAMRVHQVVTTTASTVYTVSAYFKAAEASWISFRISEDTAPSCWFDVANGVVGARESGWSASSIANVGNGWFRCQATFTTIGTSYTFRFTLANANNSTDYTGNGVNGVLIWGAQLNTGSTALQYKSPQVAQWSDKSGNGRHVSQATAVNQPTYTPSGLNGKPVLTFTGTNFLNRTNDTFLQNVPAVSAFTVVSYADYVTSRRAVNITAVSSGATRLTLFGTASSLQSLGRRLSTDSFSVSSAAAVAANTPVIHGSQLDFANNSNTAVVNGVVAPAATFSSGAGNSENALVTIDMGTAVGSQLFLGTMAETVFVNGILSTDNRQRLEGYLAWKWNLVANLPSGHPYKNSPPIV